MKSFISVNRWKFDHSRGLHENCKTPWHSDDQLVHYLTKRANEDDENSIGIALTAVPSRKRGPIRKVSNNAAPSSKTVVKKN